MLQAGIQIPIHVHRHTLRTQMGQHTITRRSGISPCKHTSTITGITLKPKLPKEAKKGQQRHSALAPRHTRTRDTKGIIASASMTHIHSSVIQHSAVVQAHDRGYKGFQKYK